jgi:hypothetical protein
MVRTMYAMLPKQEAFRPKGTAGQRRVAMAIA